MHSLAFLEPNHIKGSWINLTKKINFWKIKFEALFVKLITYGNKAWFYLI